jgi:hypothetical protein
MNQMKLINQGMLVAASIFLMQAAPVFAADMVPLASERAEHVHEFNWIQHTQQTLDDLKRKLNLSAEQTAAWSTWSSGVLKDAQQQLEQKKSMHDEKDGKAKRPSDETTPERMARGIEQLRTETAWMQEHLVKLEAAQARTKTFYDALNTNQKTIFDLYWHEMYHQVAGHDGAMPGRMRAGIECGQGM